MSHNEQISLEREDLFISPDLVTVDYVFRNQGDKDIATLVAFPMPAIANAYETPTSVPDGESDNFLGFTVEMDGKAISPKLEQRAFAAGIDVTDELKAHDIPLAPFSEAASSALARLSPGTLADWVRRGLVYDIPDASDDDGTYRHPRWELRSTYWWEATFPAGQDVRVSHRYKPAVGMTAGLYFYGWDGKRSEYFDEYAARYCIDSGFEKAVAKRVGADGGAWEQRLEYILTSGGNWANGTIGVYHLTVDKGSPGNLVSFCGTGVKKTGPTRFEMTAENYFPDKDVHILIIGKGGQ